MTNRERYQKTFGALHASQKMVLEVTQMRQNTRKFRLTRIAVAVACLMALLVTTAFAANEVTDGALMDYIKIVVNGQEMTLDRQGTTEEGVPIYGGTIQEDEDSSTDLWVVGGEDQEGGQPDISVNVGKDGSDISVQADGTADSTVGVTLTGP